MPRGGRRAGAGRKPAPLIAPEPIIDIGEFISQHVPPGSRHLRRRVVLALAAFNAAPREIALVLGISEATMLSLFTDELELGRIALRSNVAAELARAATGHGRKFSVPAAMWLLKRTESRERHEQPDRR